MNRRDFLRTAGGATAVAGAATGAAGSAAAQETKTVVVGPGGSLVYEPADITVKPGTTVTFDWESDNHNIVVGDQPEGANWEGTEGPPSKTYNTGHTYEFTFEVEGTYEYWCEPHKTAGMVGTVTVSEDAGAGGGGAATEVDPEHMGVPIQAHFVGLATVLMILVSLVFTFFLLKYGESPNAKGGD